MQWAEQNGGCAGVKSGFLLRRDPDILYGPDIYYVRPENMPPEGIPEAFWLQAPDLAVEVVSPSESASDIQQKVMDYLEGGSFAVWLVYPRTRQIVTYTPDQMARVFQASDTLEQPDLLPEFRCLVGDLFR
jgi:Uma2 family endonuclease